MRTLRKLHAASLFVRRRHHPSIPASSRCAAAHNIGRERGIGLRSKESEPAHGTRRSLPVAQKASPFLSARCRFNFERSEHPWIS